MRWNENKIWRCLIAVDLSVNLMESYIRDDNNHRFRCTCAIRMTVIWELIRIRSFEEGGCPHPMIMQIIKENQCGKSEIANVNGQQQQQRRKFEYLPCLTIVRWERQISGMFVSLVRYLSRWSVLVYKASILTALWTWLNDISIFIYYKCSIVHSLHAKSCNWACSCVQCTLHKISSTLSMCTTQNECTTQNDAWKAYMIGCIMGGIQSKTLSSELSTGNKIQMK